MPKKQEIPRKFMGQRMLYANWTRDTKSDIVADVYFSMSFMLIINKVLRKLVSQIKTVYYNRSVPFILVVLSEGTAINFVIVLKT